MEDHIFCAMMESLQGAYHLKKGGIDLHNCAIEILLYLYVPLLYQLLGANLYHDLRSVCHRLTIIYDFLHFQLPNIGRTSQLDSTMIFCIQPFIASK